MKNQSFLLFSVQDLRYAIAATRVREVFKLPELTPTVNMPTDIIGVLNYRGRVLPVMHLARRLGHIEPTCRLSDSLVVVESQEVTVGMIVQNVEDVRSLDAASIQRGFSLGRDTALPVRDVFLDGIATIEEQMVMLLNPDTLIREVEEVAELSVDKSTDSSTEERGDALLHPTGFFERYCPQATWAEQQIFQQRAAALNESLVEVEDERRSLAVMRLGQEYFGIDLDQVREFIRISGVTPIPCCPPHIVGNMNLRGEVMTLLDIRGALHVDAGPELPSEMAADPSSMQAHGDLSARSGPGQALDKAIVVDIDGVVAGIPVDRICEIAYISQDDIAPVPAANTAASQNYFSGVAVHQERVLSILDFPKLLAAENLTVNETV